MSELEKEMFGEKIYSKQGNEYRRPQKECFLWQTVRAVSNATFNDEGISLYLTAGAHTLSLEGIAEPMALAEIRFEQAPAALPYAEQLAAWKAAGYTSYDGSMISVQGEDAFRKSTNTLYAVENRTSSLTEPFDLKLTQLNCIGGNNWNAAGNQMTYDAARGLYTITFEGKADAAFGTTVLSVITIPVLYWVLRLVV